MSGPATSTDGPIEALSAPTSEVEVLGTRTARVGALTVRRALPQRGRRTVGAWCFVDHAGPAPAAEAGAGIGPHPHIGLQTVTWVLSGEMLHRDSLGSEQVIRPGELNLMTAGRGVAHAEERLGADPTHIAQLWLAQPSGTRDGPADFEHHSELPRVELVGATATVLVGEMVGVASPARRDTDHFGADIQLQSDVVVPIRLDHEHAVIPLVGSMEAAGQGIGQDQVLYLPPGLDELPLRVTEPARLLLLGGVPFPEEVLMWWNYVARTREEITAAHADWTARSSRFRVPQSELAAIDVGPPPWAAS